MHPLRSYRLWPYRHVGRSNVLHSSHLSSSHLVYVTLLIFLGVSLFFIKKYCQDKLPMTNGKHPSSINFVIFRRRSTYLFKTAFLTSTRIVLFGLTTWETFKSPARDKNMPAWLKVRSVLSISTSTMLLIAAFVASSIVSREASVAYTSSVSTKGSGNFESLMTSTVTSISPATSIPAPIISPSAIEECISPIANKAPGVFTGRYKVALSVSNVVSRFPP